MPKKSSSKKAILVQTAEGYASGSTVHGITYVFNAGLNAVDRFLWFVVCLSFGILAGVLAYQSYSAWQEDQVVITLKSTTKPVQEMLFPAITICSPGLHMNNVESILWQNFLKWKWDNNKTNLTAEIPDHMAEYMAEVFQITDRTTNILDILDTMVASDVEASAAANAVRQNAVACAQDDTSQKKNINRKKRSEDTSLLETTG